MLSAGPQLTDLLGTKMEALLLCQDCGKPGDWVGKLSALMEMIFDLKIGKKRLF